jgi:hypothetical protein
MSLGVFSDPHGASARPAAPASSSALRFLPPPPPALPPGQQPARSRKRPLDAAAHDAAALAVRVAPPPPLPSSSALKFVLPGPKRARREPPASPTSVGDVSDPRSVPAPSPATMPSTSATATAAAASASPASAKMQSMLRGLQHVAACGAAGCANPLCVSTRNFVAKVQTHQAAAAAKPGHDGARCGACQLWGGIVRAHAPACTVVGCGVPGCEQLKQAAGLPA